MYIPAFSTAAWLLRASHWQRVLYNWMLAGSLSPRCTLHCSCDAPPVGLWTSRKLNISEPRHDYDPHDPYRRWAKQMCWEFCRFLLSTCRRLTSVQRAYQQLHRDRTSRPLIATRVRSREQNDRILSDDRPLSRALQRLIVLTAYGFLFFHNPFWVIHKTIWTGTKPVVPTLKDQSTVAADNCWFW